MHTFNKNINKRVIKQLRKIQNKYLKSCENLTLRSQWGGKEKLNRTQTERTVK